MKYHMAIILAILCLSCNSGFLEENPKGVLSPDVLFASEGGIVGAANNLPASLCQCILVIPFYYALHGR